MGQLEMTANFSHPENVGQTYPAFSCITLAETSTDQISSSIVALAFHAKKKQ